MYGLYGFLKKKLYGLYGFLPKMYGFLYGWVQKSFGHPAVGTPDFSPGVVCPIKTFP